MYLNVTKNHRVGLSNSGNQERMVYLMRTVTPSPQPIFLSAADIAAEMGYTTTHIYRLFKAGKLPFVRVMGKVRPA